MSTILIVDDRPTNRELLVTLLGYAGYRVLEATEGEEGLRVARAERPDLIITDIVMPTMDGYEFARQVRADPSISETQIIFYTSSYIVAETRQLAEACGVSIVLSKPIEPETLLETVKSSLASTQTMIIPPASEKFHREHMRLLTDTLAKKVDDLEAEIVVHKQAQEKVNYQARLLRNINDAVIATDDGFLITAWNRAAEKIYGWLEKEVIGRNASEVLQSELTDEQQAEAREHLRESSTARGERVYSRKDGETLYVEENTIALTDEQGKLTGYVSVHRDITERRQAEEKFRLAIEGAPNAIVMVNSSGEIVLVNSQLEKYFGYHRTELIGQNVDRLVPVRVRGNHAHFRESFLTELGPRSMGVGRDLFALRKDGSEFPVEIGLSPIETGSGMLVLATIVDITQRKQAEEKIERQNQRLKVLREIDTAILAADLLEDIVGTALDHIRELIDCSRANLTLIDLETSELVIFNVRTTDETSVPTGSRLPLAVFSDILPTLSQNQPILFSDLRALADPSPAIQRLLKDGMRSTCSLPLFSQGNLVGMFSMHSEIPNFFDEEKVALGREVANQVAIAITQLRLMSNLRESEERFRRAIEDAPYPVMIHAEDGEIISVNKIWLKLSGYAREEIPTMSAWTERAYGERKAVAEAAINKLFALESVFDEGEDVVRTAGGEIRTWHFSSAPLGRLPDGRRIVISMASDVTDRKRAEQALVTREKRFRALIENAPDLIMVMGPDALIAFASPSVGRLLGYRPDELIGTNGFELLHPDDIARVSESFLQGTAAPGTISGTEFRLRRRDGSWRIFDGMGASIESEAGQIQGVMNARDITERKLAEEEVRLSEERFSTAFHASPVGVTITSIADGIFVDANDSFCRMFEFNREEVVGHSSTELNMWTPEERKKLIDEQIKSGGLQNFEMQARSKSGRVVDILFSSKPIELEGKTHHITTMIDITERKQAGAKIQQQLERLAALREIDRAISSTTDMRLSLRILLSHTLSLLGVDAADILLVNPALNVLEYAAGIGFRTTAIENAQVRLGEEIAGRVALMHETIHVRDIRRAQVQSSFALMIKEEGFIDYQAVPLIAKGRVLGVLEAFQRNAVERDPEWIDFLETLAGQAAIAIENTQAFEGMQRSNMELMMAYDATIVGWSHALDLRDKETEGHSQRVTELTMRLAERIGVGAPERIHIRRGALLHDIGKLGIPDSILLKPGKLTDDEWELMRRHPTYARDMLSSILYLQPALDIPYCHHEKWDGTGYPRGLKGDQIPLSARLFAVVDVWDALTSDRPYRPAWTKEKTIEYIREQSGIHFDPRVVDAFLNLIDHGR